MKKLFKKFLKADDADVRMIGIVVGIFVTLAIAVVVFYNIAASIDATSLDADIGETNTVEVANATDNVLDHTATFFEIAPIIGIVIVAVVILGYVGRIGGQ